MKESKRIDIKEFREFGFLQELNRQFLHPMGLALEVIVDDETGEEKLGGVWDYRDDPVGIIYDIVNSDKSRIDNFNTKAIKVNTHLKTMISQRIDQLGFGVETIPEQLEYTNITDNENIKKFNSSLVHSTADIEDAFNEILFPITYEDKNYRVYSENSSLFSLLYIEDFNAHLKTYNKSEYMIKNLTLIKIDK